MSRFGTIPRSGLMSSVWSPSLGAHGRRGTAATSPGALATGAAGLWLMKNYANTNGIPIVQNSASAVAVFPQQIARQSRRIACGIWNYSTAGGGAISLEAQQAGTDHLPFYADRFGNTEAIRITLATSATSGFLVQQPKYFSSNTYTMAIDVRLVSGSGKFNIGNVYENLSSELTATSSWQRFSFTFSNSTGHFCIGHNGPIVGTVLEINNFNIFLGSTDLGVEAYGGHLKVGVMNENGSAAGSPSYASGVLTSPVVAGIIEFETAHQPNATTIFFYGTVIQPFFEPILQGILSQPSGDGYMAGLNVIGGGIGLSYGPDGGGSGASLLPIATHPQTVWDNSNPHVYAIRWDGTTATWWVDGVVVYTGSPTVYPASIPTITQLMFNVLTSHPCNFAHKATAYYLRALSNSEMTAMSNYLVANA